MNINFIEKKIEDNNGQYSVSLDGSDWAKYISKAETNEMAKLQIPGFRKGHIPLNIAKKHLNPQAIIMRAGNKFLDDAYKIIYNNQDKKFYPLNYQLVEVKITDISDKNIAANFVFPLPPEVKNIENWKKLVVDLNVKSNIDLKKSLKDQQNALINQKSQTILVEDEHHKLKTKEIAVIDFEGSIDGKIFDGGTGKKFELLIGSNQFIPGFEDQLIGMVAGTEKDVKVTFPQDYQAKQFAGKAAVFHVFLHEIKINKTPKFDDEFIKSQNLENITTVNQWNAMVTKNIENDIKKDISENKDEILLNALITQLPISLSKKIIELEYNSNKKEFYKRIEELKVPKEILLAQMQKSEDEILKQMQEDSLNRLKLSILLNTIANSEKIELNEKLYTEWIEKAAKEAQTSPEELVKKIPISTEVLSRIRNEIVWNRIKKHYSK